MFQTLSDVYLDLSLKDLELAQFYEEHNDLEQAKKLRESANKHIELSEFYRKVRA